MKDIENIQQELEELSPFLSKLKSEQPTAGFDVPPVYFRQLTEEVLTKIQPEYSPTVNVNRWQQFLFGLQPKQLAYAVATVLILVVAIPFFWQEPKSVPANLTSEEALSYIEANLTDFDMELLLQEVEGIEELYFEVPQDEVEEYLQDNMENWTIEEWETLF